MSVTRRGKYIRIEQSPYFFETEEFIFFFATKYKKTVFKSRYLQNRKEVNKRLSKRWKMNITMNTLADFYLYLQYNQYPNALVIDKIGGRKLWLKYPKCDGMIEIEDA